MDVGVVLAENIGKEPMVVEVEFERIFGGWLRNGFAKPRAVYSRAGDPESRVDSSAALRGSYLFSRSLLKPGFVTRELSVR
jgi:hypothetical protein